MKRKPGTILLLCHSRASGNPVRNLDTCFRRYDSLKRRASTLVAAKVTPERLNQTVKIINHYENVTHNYLRSHSYNLWFTLVGKSRRQILDILNEIKRKCSLSQVMNLPAKRVFKLKVLNRHRLTSVNVMAVWNVPTDKILKTGKIMAKIPEVSHCYQRVTLPNWPYNLYTMMHTKSERECKRIIQNIVRKTGITKYELLYTLKGYKKKSAGYLLMKARQK